MSLFLHTTNPEEACHEITSFYSNYNSQRYASGRLILRVRQAPDADQLRTLNNDFEDIIVSGSIERTDPTTAELDENDALDCDRITFLFDRRQFGRLRQMINRLNEIADLPETTRIPEPMGEEQAERPW
jgi:hypothetical protein